jgi:hypothetical protein
MVRFLLAVTLLLLFLPLISGCSGGNTKPANVITPSTGVTGPEPRPGGKT